MLDNPGETGQRVEVSIFPLPNIVLFPHAVLPLHIFEERYKEMTAHALAGDQLIAMALLQPGWEKNYYGVSAIDPMVCIGKIISHEQLPDGCYNLLLLGASRARVVRETRHRPFRIAETEIIPACSASEPQLAEMRDRLSAIFERGAFATTPIARQFRQMFADGVATADVADLIAFNFLDDIPLKQQLLAESDAESRIAQLLSALESDPPPPPLNLAPGGIVLPLGDDPSLN
ncbi:MAG TPA: LON peptidase substrate-binding domain-containing protein [Tepidisphaeraceae bacterium]|jgi:Lon protease-like protein|nr:LON peptidase substrate-binding domain-containing protein [Tepidisphaeraceae bacterium]